MRIQAWICVFLVPTILADDETLEERASKLPYIADAVGNTLPPPSNVPAPVGSPSNLLTPDRYEFYTFDDSGELVKRLMTLEEIQTIVAAGEGTDGHLVTISNDDQPTIAFNFSQPPFTKVHSVVTNVQNVLKAQMEAQKKNPPSHASLDTPDVSDSWSLILPSIFGNTGVDIMPDKSPNTFTTPDTETIEEVKPLQTIENSFSKEGSNDISSNSSTTTDIKTSVVTEKIITSTTKSNSYGSSTRVTTSYPDTIRTNSPKITKSTTVSPKITTPKIKLTTRLSTNVLNYTSPTDVNKNSNMGLEKIQHVTKPNKISSTEKTDLTQFQKINPVTTQLPYFTKTNLPVTKFSNNSNSDSKTPQITATTTKYVSITTLATTEIPLKIQPIATTNKPTTQNIAVDNDKGSNATTLTTQSVSPSTTITTTEIMTIDKTDNSNKESNENEKDIKENNTNIVTASDVPIFDVAQSISQIASDLGNNFPDPTTSNLLDSTKINNMNVESKESLEMDIPIDLKNETVVTVSPHKPSDIDNTHDSFVKVSTINPTSSHSNKNINETIEKDNTSHVTTTITTTKLHDKSSTGTTIDPILSESMGDLLSQVVNQLPPIVQTTIKNVHESNPTTISVNNFTFDITTSITPTIMNIKVSEIVQSELNKDVVTQVPPITEIFSMTTENIDITNITNKYVEISHSNVNDSKLSSLQNSNEAVVTKNTTLLEQNISVKDDTNFLNNSIKSQDIVKEEMNKGNGLNEMNTHEKIITYNTSDNKGLNINPINSTGFINSVSDVKKDKPNKHISNKLADIKTTNPIIKVTTENYKINIPLTEQTAPPKEEKKKIQKVNIDDKEFTDSIRNNSWKLISTVSPPKANEIIKDKIKVSNHHFTIDGSDANKEIILDVSKENQGLEVTTKDLGDDIFQFSQLCNELAFRYWNAVLESIDKRRSFVLSPFSITSMLAMMFMGARGATSGEMNEILKLDDMVTFNPHFTLKNISDSIETSPESGVAVSAFIRELYSDRNRGNILTFYKERAQHFYNGHVEEVNFKLINDIIRRRTNLLVKRYTWGKIGEYMKTNSINMLPPLAAFSTNIFETDCTGSSVERRDGEMYFVVSPNVRQRRLVPVPAVVYKTGFLAGYDPVLDATAASLGMTNSIVSTLFLMPGQQGNVVHAEDLEALEQRLLESTPTILTWNRLLRTLLPRIGLELQIPRFSHKSTFNVSSTLKVMGLKDLFDPENADLGGLHGPSKDLYLSDMVQTTTFVTCGEGVIGEQHHIEEYPESAELTRRRRTSRWTTAWDEPRDYQRAFHDPHDVGEAMHLPLHLRPRQARLPARNAQPARLKFDRPFLYFVRHNPSGMILYVGRYNPRLLP